MLDFNQWYFVLLINFLVLLGVLNAILFQPLKKVFKERDAATKGAIEEAKALVIRKDETLARMNTELMDTRTKAKAIQNGLRDEGMNRQKEVMTATESQAVAMIEQARKELQAETDRARAVLKADVERFSEEIAGKLITV
jgi:F-type H+-transporting ATPase subunit b